MAVTAEALKTCSLCRRAKPLTSFHRNGQSKDGRHPGCAVCKRAKGNGYYQRWTPEQRLKHRRRMLRHRHGVDTSVIDLLHSQQDGRCAICQKKGSKPFSAEGEGRRAHEALQIDHDHSTGAIRGLLCFECNTGIGKLGDSAELLERAVTYLLKERGQ